MAAAPGSAGTASQNPPGVPAPTRTKPPVGAATSGTGHIRADDGSTFDIEYSYFPYGYYKDTTDQVGLSAIQMTLEATFVLENTTPGRGIEFMRSSGDPEVALIGLWPAGTPICSLPTQPVSGQWCGILLASAELDSDLEPDGRMDPRIYSGGVFADGFGVLPGITDVPDDQYRAVLAELKHPRSYALAYSGDDSGRFVSSCPNSDLTDFLKGHPLEEFDYAMIPISSPTGSCSAITYLEQPHH